ncbi:type II toxin-antitoxin system Phd/YefM family antitoxin [Magnetococcales bacterium HHB-1]
MDSWQLQTAKSRFSELVKRTASHGPQRITVRGEPEAVMVSKAQFDQMMKPKPSLVEFLRASPLVGVDLDLERDQATI